MRVSHYRKHRSSRHAAAASPPPSRCSNAAPQNEAPTAAYAAPAWMTSPGGMGGPAAAHASTAARNNTASHQDPGKQQFKYPLLGKVFYLDVPQDEAGSLPGDIQRLGGRIEDTFSPKKVTHVVTNRSLDAEQGPSAAEQARLKYSSSRLRRVELMLRTKQMRSFKGEDILQVAQKSRKRIIPLEKMRKYVNKRLPEVVLNMAQPLPAPVAPPLQAECHSRSPPSPSPPPPQPQQQPQPPLPVAPMDEEDPSYLAPLHVARPLAKSPFFASPYCSPGALYPSGMEHAMRPDMQPSSPHFMHGFVQPIPLAQPTAAYVRLEDASRAFKPVFRVFEPTPTGDSTIPELNFSVPPPYTPFHGRAECQKLLQVLSARAARRGDLADKKMESARSRRPVRVIPKKGGYCECCRVRYSDYVEHVESEQHRAFEEDESNYVMLDNMIADGK